MRAADICINLIGLWYSITVAISYCVVPTLSQAESPIVVKNTVLLGPQLTPDVTNVSRDGGFSVLVNGKITWLYDDTECMNVEGLQSSFVSNTAAFASQPNKNVSIVEDFGVMMVGKDKHGKSEYAILADITVGTGGWIPFLQDELDFNKQKDGTERVAIWPGTSPTPISTTQAFLFAPLVYVDSKPQDPSKEYQGRGMALITITAPRSGPVATRQGDLIIPGTQVAFGGFAALLGLPSTESLQKVSSDRDVYLIGMTNGGLQMARVGLDHVTSYAKYTYFDPEALKFTRKPPSPSITDYRKIYLPGTFSSGSVFYSPYFNTFIMIYFNKMADSTFYIRYLNLDNPLEDDANWVKGGKNGTGILQEDAEALTKYAWSPEQTLFVSPTGKGGFNYAGTPHPSYFNRQYFAPSLYPDNTPDEQRKNDWYGSNLVPEDDAGGDGRYLLLSWTSQLRGGTNSGIYQIQLAMVEFDIVPTRPGSSLTSNKPGVAPSPTNGDNPYKTPQNMIPNNAETISSLLGYGNDRGYDFWAILRELGLLGGVIGVAFVF